MNITLPSASSHASADADADIELQLPWGTWLKDLKFKELRRYQLVQACNAIKSFCMALFTWSLSWSKKECQVLAAKIKRSSAMGRITCTTMFTLSTDKSWKPWRQKRHDLFIFCLLARFDKGKCDFKKKKEHILQVCADIVWYYDLVTCWWPLSINQTVNQITSSFFFSDVASQQLIDIWCKN